MKTIIEALEQERKSVTKKISTMKKEKKMAKKRLRTIELKLELAKRPVEKQIMISSMVADIHKTHNEKELLKINLISPCGMKVPAFFVFKDCYQGAALVLSEKLWRKLTAEDYPASARDALFLLSTASVNINKVTYTISWQGFKRVVDIA